MDLGYDLPRSDDRQESMGRYLLGFAALMMASIAAGYMWSRLDRPEEQVAEAAATVTSPEQQPADAPLNFAPPERQVADLPSAPAQPEPQTAEAPASYAAPDDRSAVEASVTYSGCNEVRALGKAPLHAGEPGYRTDMDGDGDGLACEPIRPRSS
jgi:hypothetical protein